MYVNTLIGETNQLGREEFHGADCNIIIYSIYVIYAFICFRSELKHLINYGNINKLDTVSSGERIRC